jgi:Tfp pilus assembly major pilin PilA
MVVIDMICILAAIAIPNFISYRKKAKIVSVVANLKNFEKGFKLYAIDEGQFPNDSHIGLPDLPKMENYINPEVWGQITPLGGTFNWEGPDNYPYIR